MFTTQEERDNAQRSYVIDLPTIEISDFPDHPFKVRMDEEMEQMVERQGAGRSLHCAGAPHAGRQGATSNGV
jgi:hypothetical protein